MFGSLGNHLFSLSTKLSSPWTCVTVVCVLFASVAVSSQATSPPAGGAWDGSQVSATELVLPGLTLTPVLL